MLRKKFSKKQILILSLAFIIAPALCALTFFLKGEKPRELYKLQLEAAEKMQACMDEIKSEKLSRGISIPEEDTYETGMIGESFNFITTTMGDIASKRTSANADMAALLVVMFNEAGLKGGDTLACNFSGSFPALNIATICAAEAMDITPVYIASCGASTWGANNPGLSFPEMAAVLYDKGLIKHTPALVTMGGGDDVGKGIDAEEFAAVWERALELGYPTLIEEDFAANVSARKNLFDAAGAKAFIAVGGNITSTGGSMIADGIGQGIITENIYSISDSSGLIERYVYEGTKTMLLLNIRQLVADYGMSFDSAPSTPIGTGSIYRETTYQLWIIYVMLAIELGLLISYKCISKNEKTKV